MQIYGACILERNALGIKQTLFELWLSRHHDFSVQVSTLAPFLCSLPNDSLGNMDMHDTRIHFLVAEDKVYLCINDLDIRVDQSLAFLSEVREAHRTMTGTMLTLNVKEAIFTYQQSTSTPYGVSLQQLIQSGRELLSSTKQKFENTYQYQLIRPHVQMDDDFAWDEEEQKRRSPVRRCLPLCIILCYVCIALSLSLSLILVISLVASFHECGKTLCLFPEN